MKGIIEVEFVKIGKESVKDLKMSPQEKVEFRKSFDNNWNNITKMIEMTLTKFYNKYKIKIKLNTRIQVK